MEFKKFKNFYILKFSQREEIQKSIEEDAILAHYSVKDKKYTQKSIKKPLELTSLIGNVCFSGGKIIIHSHAVLADKNLKTFSGHLVDVKVSSACEIIFIPFNKKIQKVYDKITGLKLMKF
jgi:predicted DNA-binding protein with PD1-like motif